jgi:hypothetical protein
MFKHLNHNEIMEHAKKFEEDVSVQRIKAKEKRESSLGEVNHRYKSKYYENVVESEIREKEEM